MRISIIIPTLNESKNIGHLISFLKQNADQRLLDIIIVDAHSSDNTEGVALCSGALVIQSPKRSRAIQMNLGAQHAQGDILYFIHADCRPPASFLDDIQQALTEGYALGCYRYHFDSQSAILKINSFFTRFRPLWCRGGDETLFIAKKKFEQLNGYDESYCIMEEYDFIRRARTQLKFKIIPKYATVSARKYQKNSWLRVQFANLMAFNMFRLGFSSKKIAYIYRFLIATD